MFQLVDRGRTCVMQAVRTRPEFQSKEITSHLLHHCNPSKVHFLVTVILRLLRTTALRTFAGVAAAQKEFPVNAVTTVVSNEKAVQRLDERKDGFKFFRHVLL